MKKLTTTYILLILIGTVICGICFILGDMERGYDSTGGEVFTLALPILAAWMGAKRGAFKSLLQKN